MKSDFDRKSSLNGNTIQIKSMQCAFHPASLVVCILHYFNLHAVCNLRFTATAKKIIVTEELHRNRKTTSNIKTCAYRFANGTILELLVHVDIK